MKSYEITNDVINKMVKDGVWDSFIETIPEVAKNNVE